MTRWHLVIVSGGLLVGVGGGCPLHPESVSRWTVPRAVASQDGHTKTGVGVSATGRHERVAGTGARWR